MRARAFVWPCCSGRRRGESSDASSDLDVRPSFEAGAEAGQRLEFELSRVSHRRVDLVRRDEAPPLLRFEIARDGRVRLERVPHAWTDSQGTRDGRLVGLGPLGARPPGLRVEARRKGVRRGTALTSRARASHVRSPGSPTPRPSWVAARRTSSATAAAGISLFSTCSSRSRNASISQPTGWLTKAGCLPTTPVPHSTCSRTTGSSSDRTAEALRRRLWPAESHRARIRHGRLRPRAAGVAAGRSRAAGVPRRRRSRRQGCRQPRPAPKVAADASLFAPTAAACPRT